MQGKVRKYYQLTTEGRRFFEKKRTEWEQYAKAVTNVLAFQM
jgi:DNA-binding PadR family transcriptional regulator